MRLLVPFALVLTLLLAGCGDDDPAPAVSAVLPDGGHFHGQMVDGRLQGDGRIDYPDGRWYVGQFKDGQFSGDGKLKMLDGAIYQGQFAEGSPNGKGIYKKASGDQYTGNFVKGDLEGEGTYSSKDGGQYTGNFHKTQMDGNGHYEDADGNAWTGTFKAGKLNGQGELAADDGSQYKGHFEDWRFSGDGELSLADGSSYKGQFADDEYSGKGALTLADGRVQSGEWANGLWLRDSSGKRVPDALENALLDQGHLLERALAAVPASGSKPELYSLTVAGNGEQSVFMREAAFVDNLLAKRFGAYGQISLVNHRDHLDDRPLATRENISRAIRTLAERSGPQDLIFIYLTSHGSHDHQLALVEPRLELSDLSADEFAEMLKPLRNRDKIVVVSACYSGGFIPPLKDEHTLIITAAREDRVSFGCSEEADFTYFGDALFNKALTHTDDLQAAFDEAKDIVAAREKEEHFDPSEPQIWAPTGVLARWHALRENQARQALDGATQVSRRRNR